VSERPIRKVREDIVRGYLAVTGNVDDDIDNGTGRDGNQVRQEVEFSFQIALARTMHGGSVGMGWAEKAKKLVENDPTLLLPENKDKLLNETRSAYFRDHALTVTLSPEDIALADMIATHEDDLPNA
jgi:hypothetical protein